MITEEQLAGLKGCDGGAPVLSAYINIPPGLQPERAYITTFRTLAQGMRDRLSPERQATFDPLARAFEAWLESEPPQGRAAVAFGCQETGLWQTFFVPFPVADHVAFEERPHLTPLLDLLDEHERYGVVIVDKEQSRFLSVRFGEIESDQRFESDIEEPESHTGWDDGKYDQQYEGHVQQHLKRVADRLETFHKRRSFRRLLLGGPVVPVTGLKALLSPPLAATLAGTFNVDIDMSPSEILERTLPAIKQAKREEEAQLVSVVIDRGGPNGRGIRGISDTLRAVWNAAVDTLVVAEGLRVPGGECTNCGRLEAGNVTACPVCQGVTRPVDDVVAWAVARTLQQSGSVEIVHDGAATQLLAEGEGLGATMRFAQSRLA